MFYSHDILTSRKYGIATVWLVATLGSKSLLKRVSRKEILDVNVKKACETIEMPEVPMSLRLQSNLLYGITRVHSQQCGYLLADAETVKNSLRVMYRTLHTGQLDAEGRHKARADELLLPDDNDLLRDIDLVHMNIDQLALDLGYAAEESQRLSLAPNRSQDTDGSLHTIPELDILGISGSVMASPVGSSLGWGASFSRRILADNEQFLQDDLFVVDPDGTIRFAEVTTPQRTAHQGMALHMSGHSTVVTSHGTSNLNAQHQNFGLEQMEHDGALLMHDDDDIQAPSTDKMQPRHGTAKEAERESTSETAMAPARRRNKPVSKAIPIDAVTELSNGDLARWSQDYVANMRQAARRKDIQRAMVLAKQNAKVFVLGTTISQAAPGQSKIFIDGPLGIFSGARLLKGFTGINWLTSGRKRDREAADEAEERNRKRSRGSTESLDQQASGAEYKNDHQTLNDAEYTGVEAGREQPSPLDDRHLSSLMPWNQSTGSRRPTGVFGSATGAPHAPHSRRGSRMPSASPLVGRGHLHVGSWSGADSQQGFFSEQAGFGDFSMVDAGDIELYNPAAQVNTHTAAESQWQGTVLDAEANNFLAFVTAAISDAAHNGEEAGMGDGEREASPGSISFETLLPPKNNSRTVAAQGLLHVLTLVTRNLLNVEQDEDYGTIVMRVV